MRLLLAFLLPMHLSGATYAQGQQTEWMQVEGRKTSRLARCRHERETHGPRVSAPLRQNDEGGAEGTRRRPLKRKEKPHEWSIHRSFGLFVVGPTCGHLEKDTWSPVSAYFGEWDEL